jgi:uncharacterized membrane protein
VVGIVLAEEVGRNVPQDVPLQETDQFTPRLRLSLVTVAAIPHCSANVAEVGGVKAGVKATVMGGSEELRAPQPRRRVSKAVAMITLMNWRRIEDDE